MRERLLGSLVARLTTAEAGDLNPVLAADAVDESSQLLDYVANSKGLDIEVLHRIGWLHWARAQAYQRTGREPEPADIERAVTCLAPLFLVDQSNVPRELAEEFREIQSPAEAGEAGRTHDCADALLGLAALTANNGVLNLAATLSAQAAYRLAEPGDPRRANYLITHAAVLSVRYERAGDQSNLHQAADALAEADKLMSPGHAERIHWLTVRCEVLRLTLTHSDDEATARAAVETGRAALETCPADYPNRAYAMQSAGLALHAAAIRVHDAGLMAESVAAARESLKLSPPGSSQRHYRQNNLGFSLVSNAGATGDPARRTELLAEAAPLFEEVIAGTQTEHPLHASGQYGLGLIRYFTWQLHRESGRLDRATRLLDQAVRALSASIRLEAAAPQLPARLNSLGNALAAQSGRSNAPAVRDQAIEAYQRALQLISTDHPQYLDWLGRLAFLLRERAFDQRTVGSADQSAKAYERLLELTPPDATEYSDRQSWLTAARVFAETLRSTAPVPAANAPEDGGPTYARIDLAALLARRAHDTGEWAHLAAAEQLLRTELAEPGLTGGPAAAAHANLAGVCYLRFQHGGEQAVLHEAISHARRALELSEDRQPQRMGLLGELLRSDQREGALDEAIQVGWRAVHDCPLEHPIRPKLMYQLANTLRIGYDRFGDPAHLDHAIALERKSAELNPADADWLGLASLLRARFQRTGDLASLTESISVGRRALAAMPEGHPQRPKTLTNLAVQLLTHFRRTESAASLTDAIDLAEKAVATTPEGHVALGSRLGNLGLALGARFDLTREPGDLTATLEVERRAVAAVHTGHPDRARLLANLGQSLREHAELTHSTASLTEAAVVLREAVSATPAGHPGEAMRRLQLAATLLTQVGETGNPLRLFEALRTADSAAKATMARPLEQLLATAFAAKTAAAIGRRGKAAETYRRAVELLPKIAPRNLDRTDLEHRLAQLSEWTMASDAAAMSIRVGKRAQALELLEQGRGVLLAYALDAQQELDELRAAAPGLAEEFSSLREQLDQVGAGPRFAGEDEQDTQGETDRRHRLAVQWEDVVGRIRALPGHGQFLLPPRVADMAPAASGGPVITVNVSEHGCAALILTTRRLLKVRLPKLTVTELETRVRTFQQALETIHLGGMTARMEAQASIRDTLGWLWDTVTGPILAVLGYYYPAPAGQPLPRVWWSPTGALNFLPLHAAGHHTGGGPAVLDRVVSSYTPTVRALLHARTRSRSASSLSQLAVSLPETPGHTALPGADVELAALPKWQADQPRLRGSEASHDRVLAALPEASWVHFACHAHSDPNHPSDSHLLLHDRPLRVVEISRLNLPDAELAYLSACSTARGSARLADEAIHIASAFQLAGYRHVVATLWPVWDTTAATVAEGFYRRLAPAPEAGTAVDAALALHETIRELRAEQPLLPSSWASYLHAGP